MELLSPCGNYESLIGVINAGADAVYLAGSKYGARAYADNFTDDEIIKAIKYAHLFNVKVYLTVNTLVKEREYNDVLDYIRTFYEAGLDACIVQDIGLISVFSNYFPKMECHISTQAFATGVNSVKLFKDCGASRVVLAREVSLDEIKHIKAECDIEIETFIHGAMCYSYSGQCLFSSCLGGRSGNRGRCAGPCRLNYEANNVSGYLLSMKDQCTLEILPQLLDAGIDSLKIEGRMKKPEYAAFVTAMYRKYIDLYKKSSCEYKVSKEDIKELNSFYMRSEIGTGYYDTYNGSSMLCINNPAYAKTDESKLSIVRDKYLINRKKLPVDIYAECHLGKPINIVLINKDYSISIEGGVVSASINRPTSEADVIKQLSKLGETNFYADNIYVTIDENAFIPIKELNELRRQASDKLENIILSSYYYKPSKSISLPEAKDTVFEFKTLISVLTKEQLNAVFNQENLEANLAVGDELFINSLDRLKSVSNKSFDIYVNLPYVIRDKNRSVLESLTHNYSDIIKGFIVHNLEELYYLKNSHYKIIAGPGLYSWNNSAIDFYGRFSDTFINSYELSHHELNEIKAEKGYYLVYGKYPLMQSANCIEKTTDSCKKNKGSGFTYLSDRKNVKFPVYHNCSSCYNTIYNSVPTSLHNEEMPFSLKEHKYISFTDESFEETSNILNLFINNDKSYIPTDFTRGYYKRGVE